MTNTRIILPGSTDGGDLQGTILACALEVQKNLGEAAPDNACRDCFAFELERRGVTFHASPELMNRIGAEAVPSGFRVDFVVADRLIIDIRNRSSLVPHLLEQYRTFLRLSGLEAAIIVNLQAPPDRLLTRITR